MDTSKPCPTCGHSCWESASTISDLPACAFCRQSRIVSSLRAQLAAERAVCRVPEGATLIVNDGDKRSAIAGEFHRSGDCIVSAEGDTSRPSQVVRRYEGPCEVKIGEAMNTKPELVTRIAFPESNLQPGDFKPLDHDERASLHRENAELRELVAKLDKVCADICDALGLYDGLPSDVALTRSASIREWLAACERDREAK